MSDRNTQKRVNMSMNQHAEQAVNRLRNGTINEVSRAGVEATLALAYEQRTANLIAAFSELGESDPTYLGLVVDGRKLAKQIIERLDLA